MWYPHSLWLCSNIFWSDFRNFTGQKTQCLKVVQQIHRLWNALWLFCSTLDNEKKNLGGGANRITSAVRPLHEVCNFCMGAWMAVFSCFLSCCVNLCSDVFQEFMATLLQSLSLSSSLLLSSLSSSQTRPPDTPQTMLLHWWRPDVEADKRPCLFRALSSSQGILGLPFWDKTPESPRTPTVSATDSALI